MTISINRPPLVLRRVLFWAFLLVLAPASAMSDVRRYALDPAGSEIGFDYRILGQTFRGTIPVARADIVIDFSNVAKTQAEVTLDASRAKAGVALATQALRGPTVLNIRDHPTIRFIATRTRSNGSGAIMEGTLTVRGTSRPVVLDARFLRAQDSDPTERDQLTILLTGSLSRSEFGASGYADLVDDRIDLRIRAAIRALD